MYNCGKRSEAGPCMFNKSVLLPWCINQVRNWLFVKKTKKNPENSRSNFNLAQIHLVYLPKPGSISKPGINAVEI